MIPLGRRPRTEADDDRVAYEALLYSRVLGERLKEIVRLWIEPIEVAPLTDEEQERFMDRFVAFGLASATVLGLLIGWYA